MSTATNTVRWSPITDYLIGILRNLQGSRSFPTGWQSRNRPERHTPRRQCMSALISSARKQDMHP